MSQTKWQQYLRQQGLAHPSMQPRDVYKMLYQAVFGAEHLLQDKEAARIYFQKEFDGVEPADEPLYEQIGADTYRVNLAAWKKHGLPQDWLFHLFVYSVDRVKKDREQNGQTFWQLAEEAKALVGEGFFAFSHEEFERYTQEYRDGGLGAVHHSEAYRVAEHPAYRLVSGEYIRLIPILERLTELSARGMRTGERPIVVAIDGRCASGKSTMAAMLSQVVGAGVVHVDDFFLPMELRTEERLREPGGNVHYERFAEEVLPNLKRKGAFSYRRFVCKTMQLGEVREVAAADVCVVEGAYSQHPYFGEYADLKVFSHVEPEEQLKRIGERDGEAVLANFKQRWIPMEEVYFAAYGVRDRADMVV